jgi:predicted nucleic acid-binding protein
VKLVIDASVAVKWIIRDPRVEPDAEKALAILRAIRARTVEAIVPPHWRAEVFAVIARVRPRRAALSVGLLGILPLEVTASTNAYRRATQLAIALDHHLFDTLYHAVALEEGATLVTADATYFAKAKDLGGIQLLADFAA